MEWLPLKSKYACGTQSKWLFSYICFWKGRQLFSMIWPGNNKKGTWVKVIAQPCSLAKSGYLNSCNALKNQKNNIEYLRSGESAFEFKMEKINEKNHFGCLVFRILITYLITCIKYNRSSIPVYSGETITILDHMVIN